jgi:hypothetical protein
MVFRVCLSLVILFTLALSGMGELALAAKAKKKQVAKPKASYEMSMKVAVVRSSVSGCEPNCPEWIAAEGEIGAGTPALFRKVIAQIGNRKLPVIIRSPGGHMTAAMEIGKMIRQKNLDVAVGWTILDSCDPRSLSCAIPNSGKGTLKGKIRTIGGFCNSACPLILASGLNRLVGPDAFVGVHEVRTTWKEERVTYQEKYRLVNGKKKVIGRTILSRKPGKSYETYGFNTSLTAQLSKYLKQMGVDAALIEDMKKAKHNSIYKLSLTRMSSLKLATDQAGPDRLDEPLRCKSNKPAGHCRAAKPAG